MIQTDEKKWAGGRDRMTTTTTPASEGEMLQKGEKEEVQEKKEKIYSIFP